MGKEEDASEILISAFLRYTTDGACGAASDEAPRDGRASQPSRQKTRHLETGRGRGPALSLSKGLAAHCMEAIARTARTLIRLLTLLWHMVYLFVYANQY